MASMLSAIFCVSSMPTCYELGAELAEERFVNIGFCLQITIGITFPCLAAFPDSDKHRMRIELRGC